MKTSPILAAVTGVLCASLPACQMHQAEAHGHEQHQQHQIIVTSPKVTDVTITQNYVCQIRSQKHINVRVLQTGFVEAISVKEGQAVKKDDLLFKIRPIIYQTRVAEAKAEVNKAQMEYLFAQKLSQDRIVSQNEVALLKASLEKAEAKQRQAEADLEFTNFRAPFDGIINRLEEQQGSLIKEGDVLTTLSDNSVMWVYFNVPEARYLEFKAREGRSENRSRLKLVDSRIDLMLADGKKFDQACENVVTVAGQFDNKTGNIEFRADFPNPHNLLVHGQTGTVLIHQAVKNAVVIPQRAVFEVLDKQYVWVVGDDHHAHQRLITVKHVLDDIFVIDAGLEAKDRIVLEGVRQVHDNDKVEYEFRKPEEALAHQKFYAE